MPANLFDGLRILDLTWVGVGPFATKFFSDHGAQVLKIESALRPDGLRTMHPAAGGRVGLNRGGYYANRNSGKLSLGIDLGRAEGQALVRALVPLCDVVVSNFRPGIMDRFGLGYDAVRALRPDVVYACMPMFGEQGPYREFAGYGLILGAMAGTTALTSYDDGVPQGTGTNFSDHVPNPVHGAMAITAALLRRARTGQGEAIEISQLESSVNFIGPALLQAAAGASGEPAQAPVAPQGVYPCRGDDHWCAIGCTTEAAWPALADALDLPPEARASHYRKAQARRRDAPRLDEWIAARTRLHDKHELAALLRSRGVSAAAVNDAAEAMADPHLNARGHWVRLPAMEGEGDAAYNAPPVRYLGEPQIPMRRAPRLGEHTRRICRELLSMDDAAIERALAAGILFET